MQRYEVYITFKIIHSNLVKKLLYTFKIKYQNIQKSISMVSNFQEGELRKENIQNYPQPK